MLPVHEAPTCSVAGAAEIVGAKWTVLIVHDLSEGPRRFTELEHSCAGISPRTLAERLRWLEGEGILLRRSKRLPENAHAALNGFVIHVSLPALTLVYVHDLKPSAELVFPASMPWLLFALGCAFFSSVGKLLRLPARTIGALTLVGGLGNTSFVGLPMIETYYGARGLGVGILVDQAGTYLVLSTLGILVATWYRQEGRMERRGSRQGGGAAGGAPGQGPSGRERVAVGVGAGGSIQRHRGARDDVLRRAGVGHGGGIV